VEQRRHPKKHLVIHNRAIGDINTIAGGFAGGGESSSAQRSHARSLASGEVLSFVTPSKSQKRETQPIVFTDEDLQGVTFPHDDTLVVTLLISNYNVHKVLIDTGRLADILFMGAFERMAIDKGRILPMIAPLVGFNSEKVRPVGAISLPVTAGFEPVQSTIMIDFIIVNKPSAYHAIIGRPALNALRAVVSTPHLAMKFPMESGVGVVKGSQEVARFCYNAMLKEPLMKETLAVTMEVRDESKLCQGKLAEDLEELRLCDLSKIVKIGSHLSEEARVALARLLKENMDVFMWTHQDMPGIDPAIITHKLNMDPSARPVRQKPRFISMERSKAIAAE
jgi:hypothetical protein